jgi:hypothetical protein
LETVQQVVGLVTLPIAILALGLLAMIVFHRPLVRLLDRTRKITRSGIEADAPQQLLEVGPSAGEELQRLFDNALLVQRENFIRAELERLTFREATERERFLVRLLAASAIAQQFERAYLSIWGSQLGALQALNSLGVAGADVALLRPWYEQSAARDPQAGFAYTFDQWVGFLESHQLVLKREGHVQISLEGREFLKYILHQGYPLYRAG